MCTYETVRCEVQGSGKAATGWVPLSTATVYYDHPVHAQADHTLNIDFANPERGPSARVAVELHAESAMLLLRSIAQALASAPSDISGLVPDQLRELRALLAVGNGCPAVPAEHGDDIPNRG